MCIIQNRLRILPKVEPMGAPLHRQKPITLIDKTKKENSSKPIPIEHIIEKNRIEVKL